MAEIHLDKYSLKLDYEDILLCAPVAIKIPGEPLLDTEDGALSMTLKKVAEESRYDFIDTRTWNCPLSFDGVHLSREGHRIFGERIARIPGINVIDHVLCRNGYLPRS